MKKAITKPMQMTTATQYRPATPLEIEMAKVLAPHYADRMANVDKHTPAYYLVRNAKQYHEGILKTKQVITLNE